jgi:predicted DNA-binding antitoxin AbrB/MazE fold protein
MSKIIEAIYENGVFRPLEPVLLPDGEHVQVRVPEGLPSQQERLAALEAFEAMGKRELKNSGRYLRKPCSAARGSEDASSIYEWLLAGYQHRHRASQEEPWGSENACVQQSSRVTRCDYML